jgi:hypothetical protein
VFPVVHLKAVFQVAHPQARCLHQTKVHVLLIVKLVLLGVAVVPALAAAVFPQVNYPAVIHHILHQNVLLKVALLLALKAVQVKYVAAIHAAQFLKVVN